MEQLSKAEGTTSAQGLPVLAVDSQNVEVPTSSHPDHPDPNPVLSLLQIPVRSNTLQVALPHAAGVANNNLGMGVGGFPPHRCVLRSASLQAEQHICRCWIIYPQLSEALSTQPCHMSSDSTHRLTAQSLRLCHQQGVPLTCLRGILPQQHTCPCPCRCCPCRCCRCVREPQLGNDNGALSRHWAITPRGLPLLLLLGLAPRSQARPRNFSQNFSQCAHAHMCTASAYGQYPKARKTPSPHLWPTAARRNVTS